MYRIFFFVSNSRSNRLRTRYAGIFVVVVCLSFCPARASTGELSPASAAAPLELRLPDLEGHSRGLDDFRGKVVLVNFWASWCTPCIKEMPSIQRLAKEMRGKPFAVIGVNVAEGELRVKTAVKRLGIRFPVLLDKDSVVFKRWGATVLPTTYVLDKAGRVRYLGRGPLEWDGVDVVDALRDLTGARETSEPAASN